MNFIGKTVLTSNQTQVTFTDIPSTYTDLLFYVSNRQSISTNFTNMQTWLNNDTSGNKYNMQSIFTNSPSSGAQVIGFQGLGYNDFDHMYCPGANATSSTFSNTMIYIFNYASSSNKMVLVQASGENNAQPGFCHGFVGRFTGSAGISRIDFDPDGSGYNMISGSSIYVYGISNS